MDTLLREILTSRVYEVARETPLDLAPRLSHRFDNDVLLKREDLQPIFSFKIRGAYNRIARLTDPERARGVIAASAGNHAQGVAFSAKRLGLRAVIVMPRTTPEIKGDAVKALGAEVVLVGDRYAEAQQHSERLAEDTGMVFVHPFDDPLVIAGMGAYIKALQPGVQVIGVEPVDADAMAQSLAAGHRVRLNEVGMFADGVAVQQVGEHTFPIVQATVSEIIRVGNDEICAAIKDIFDDTRTIVEPAGALALAGFKSYVEARQVRGQRLAAVLSGANMNFDRLRFVAERAELGDIKGAKDGGATDPQLAEARDRQRQGQFLLDFIEAENSMGFHAPQEAMRVLALSIDHTRKGQGALRTLAAGTPPVRSPAEAGQPRGTKPGRGSSARPSPRPLRQ